MVSEERTYKIPQDCETPVQTRGEGSVFAWRYAYARSAEARAKDKPGGDCLVVRHDQRAFAFAVCDGVSQSFFGSLAARIVADGLVDWLWNADLLSTQDSIAFNENAIAEGLGNHLDALTGLASQEVSAHPLADDTPELVRGVLEKNRQEGSASTFVCGRIDRPNDRLPDGRVIFAWMGDTRLRFWGPAGERTAELGETFHTMERWSTRWGPMRPSHLRVMPPIHVQPHVHVMSLAHVGQPLLIRLMAYSDGLKLLDACTEQLADVEISALMIRADESPTSDDISFLELFAISLESLSVDDVPPELIMAVPKPLPAPDGLRVQQVRRKLRATWQPVARATGYQVEVRCDHEWSWQARLKQGVTWESFPLPPASYVLRIRAVKGDEHGDWTSEHEVRMASRTIWDIAGLVGLVALCSILALLAGMLLQTRLAGGAVSRKPTATPGSQTPTATSTSTVTPTSTAEAAAAVMRLVPDLSGAGTEILLKATAMPSATPEGSAAAAVNARSARIKE